MKDFVAVLAPGFGQESQRRKSQPVALHGQLAEERSTPWNWGMKGISL
jgi:hypothetical protein